MIAEGSYDLLTSGLWAPAYFCHTTLPTDDTIRGSLLFLTIIQKILYVFVNQVLFGCVKDDSVFYLTLLECRNVARHISISSIISN